MENKIKRLYICMGIMLIMVFGCITVSAATLINSKDVVYDNKKSGLESTTVQGAVDELYNAATDYNTLNDKVDSLKTEIINTIYPKGSIYMSTEDDTVAKVETKFGGTWERYSEGRTLVAAGTITDDTGNVQTYNAGDTGGSSDITLTTANLPSHSHKYTPSGTNSYSTSAVTTGNNSASHTHSIPQLTVSSWSGSHTHNISGYFGYEGESGSSTRYGVGWGNFSPRNDFTSTSTSITVSGQTTTASTTGGQSANHTHSITAANLKTAIGTITFTGTEASTSNTGSGTSINVQNPYTVIYMYKRVN